MEQTVLQQPIDDTWIDENQAIPVRDGDHNIGIGEPGDYDWEENLQYQTAQHKRWIGDQQGIWNDEIKIPDDSVSTPLNNQQDPPKPSRLKITSIKEIRSSPPIQYIVQDLIIPGWTYLLSGLPGTGKSLLALLLAKSIASGQPFLNTFQANQSGSVLIIDSENPSSLLKDRFEKMGISDDLPIKFLHYQDIWLDDSERLDDLIDIVKCEKPIMTIIDSLLRFHSQSENSPEAMKIVTKGLNKIARLAQIGPAILTVHHAAKKSAKNSISRGTTEINAGVDVEYGITESHGVIKFQSYKTRIESFDPIDLKIRYVGNSLDVEVISLGTHINQTALTNVKSQLETLIHQKGRPPNKGEFAEFIGQFYPSMSRPDILKFIQDGITLSYWNGTPKGPNNATLYELIENRFSGLQ